MRQPIIFSLMLGLCLSVFQISDSTAARNRELKDCHVSAIESNYKQEVVVTVSDCEQMPESGSYEFIISLKRGNAQNDIIMKETAERALLHNRLVDVVGQKKRKRAKLFSIKMK